LKYDFDTAPDRRGTASVKWNKYGSRDIIPMWVADMDFACAPAIVQALRNEDITLYGDGSQTRAFCFVDDLVEGFIRMMATGPEVTGPVNIGNPHEIPVSELAERVIRITGSASRIVHRPLPQDDPLQRCPDITLAKNLLGWQPAIELDKGLRRTAAYFQQMLAESKERDLQTAGG